MWKGFILFQSFCRMASAGEPSVSFPPVSTFCWGRGKEKLSGEGFGWRKCEERMSSWLFLFPCMYFPALSPDAPITPCRWSCAQGMCWTVVSICWGCHNKVSQPSSLNNRHLCPPSAGGWKSKIKVSAGLVPSEGLEGRICSRPLSLACRWLSSPCAYTWSSCCVCLGLNLFFLYRSQPDWIRASF